MFIGEEQVKTKYSRRSKYGKYAEYSRTKTIVHWQCDECGTKFSKCRNGKYDKSRKSYCSECISLHGAAKLASNAGRAAIISKLNETKLDKVVTGKEGYPERYIGPNYPYRQGGYRHIREHIFVMETHLGRGLKKGEVVHHIDGDKTNNSIENLYLTHVAEHNKLHAASEKLVFELVKQGVVVFDRSIGRYVINRN